MHESPTTRKISIVSFNAFGAPFHAQRVLKTLFTTHVYKRLFSLSEEMNASDADIIALQEVNTYPQYMYLRYRLINFPYVYYKRYIQGPRGGVVFFSKLPFEKVTYITFEKSGSFMDKSIVASLIKRGLLIGKVAGMPLEIINTHLTHNVLDNNSEEGNMGSIHTAQLAHIIEYTEGQTLQNKTIILSGDFNIPKSEMLFNEFLIRSQMIDVFHEFTESTYHEEYNYKNKPLGRIDHMFLLPNGNKVSILKKKQLFEEKVLLKNGQEHYLSDHIGLYAQFSIES